MISEVSYQVIKEIKGEGIKAIAPKQMLQYLHNLSIYLSIYLSIQDNEMVFLYICIIYMCVYYIYIYIYIKLYIHQKLPKILYVITKLNQCRKYVLRKY